MRTIRTRPPLRWLAAGILIGAPLLVLVLVATLRGPALIEITSPDPGEIRPNEAVEVFLHFPRPERTRPETLRVEVNGADVTGDFVTASNGAFGSVVLVVDGENVLRASVFGEPWWSGEWLVEHAAELRFRVERPVDAYWG